MKKLFDEPLIPILGAIIRTRFRNEKDKTKIDGWCKQSYNTKMPWENDNRRIRIWIAEYTTGRFYLDLDTVAFEDEKDYTIFSLWYKE